MKLLCIDPGKSTGVARYDTDHPDYPVCEEVPGGLPGFVEWIGDNWDWPDRVVIELWSVKEDTWRKKAEPDAYLILGHAQGMCLSLGIPYKVVPPATHKSFSRPKGGHNKIRMLNWSEKTTDGHADDGASLLLIGLREFDRPTYNRLLSEMTEDL